MYIPKENVRKNARINFIKRMYELDLPFYVGDGYSYIARIRYKKNWITIVAPFTNDLCGMLPEMAKLIEGRVIANDTAGRFFNRTKKHKNSFILYNNNWYNEQITPAVIRSVSCIRGHNLPPHYLRQFINPWCDIETNNVTLMVLGYRFIEQKDGSKVCFKLIHFKQKWKNPSYAHDMIDEVQGLIELSDFPMVVRASSRGDEYLEKLGWKAVAKNHIKGLYYMPHAVAHNANLFKGI